jgi:pyruvate/2-oxoglutarate dehydrogenase complex dihydrolipoamide acyltransferase (E2) component
MSRSSSCVKVGDTHQGGRRDLHARIGQGDDGRAEQHAGVVKEVLVKVGDKVGEGAVLIKDRSRPLRRGGARTGRCAAPPPAAARPPRHPGAAASPAATPAARPTSNATCSCSAPAPAATRRPSARRPRPEDRDRRALRDARRRLPERRLHPVQGAAARRRVMDEAEHMADKRHHFCRAEIDLDKRCARTRTRSSAS